MERKKNIAFLMGILENEYSNSILEGAVKGAEDYDVNLIVFPMDLISAEYADWDVNRYRYQYNILASYMNMESLDGIIVEYGSIVSALNEEEKKDFLSIFEEIPTILLSEDSEQFSSICIENNSGLIELIEHLIIDHGYKKIGYLSGTKDNYDAEIRLKVFKDTVSKHNLFLGEDWIEYGNFSPFIEEQVKNIIERHPDIEVLVCANDAMAIGAAETMRKMGIEPGIDMFVTGFDNIVSGFLYEPTITSVDTNPGMLAYKAIEELLDFNPNPHSISIGSKMIIRESCGCHGYVVDEKWKQSYGIFEDWRKIAQFQMKENETRRGLEHELGNVTREMVFARETENERYESILKTVRRLEFKKCSLFLYDENIRHGRYDKWVVPEFLNLVGYYTDLNTSDNYTFPLGEKKYRTSALFNDELFRDDQRHLGIVLPLFFGEMQMGLLVAETEKKKFEYALDMAGQISSTLYIIEMHEEQRRMKLALEAASQSKSRFLANMSHEIRTPINAVIGFDEMILRENENADIDEYAHDIKNAANALLLIVNDTLDFSKIEAGKMELINETYSISGLLKNIVSILNVNAENKGLSLYFKYDESIPDSLIGDSGKIQQVLINILSNAIKYTNVGTVTLTVNGRTDGDKEYLSFSVKDTGIGIKEEDIGHLFTAYERIEEKKNRHIEGTGLGMSIVTGLLKIMGSELRVQSKYGEGSDFSFELEQKIDVSGKPGADTDADGSKARDNRMLRFEAPELRLLVVDDNFLNRKVFGSLLKETKIQVDKADSGRSCIEMLKECQYDIVFIDHMMPDMDGIETLEEIIKDNIIDTTKIPVVALTANALSGAREMYIENGFADYLPKPVLPKDLYAMIIKHSDKSKIHYLEEN